MPKQQKSKGWQRENKKSDPSDPAVQRDAQSDNSSKS